jgi:hypothetical protein
MVVQNSNDASTVRYAGYPVIPIYRVGAVLRERLCPTDLAIEKPNETPYS